MQHLKIKHLYQLSLIFILSTFVTACHTLAPANKSSLEHQHPSPIRIAFMPDIHFHDIYGEFPNNEFKGLATQTAHGKRNATIRTMQSQLQSTRLFNENYFALLAALDDMVKRGITHVALPGDFSDDGQPLHMRGLKKILDDYHDRYGLEFFSAPGNHDPTRPFSHPAGKPDYLGHDGKQQAIFSHQHPACLTPQAKASATTTPAITASENPGVICSDEVQELGYEPIMQMLGKHGFYPKKNYHYFATPFSDYSPHDYRYELAAQQAEFGKRQYEICHQGTGGKYKKANYTDCYQVPDSSYVVEPIAGVWLLAIDANVYQPTVINKADAQKNSHQKSVYKNTSNNASAEISGDAFSGSGDAGYNKVITHKTHLIEWIRAVVQQAAAENKTLIAFSHFPMHEFYDGASDDIADIFGDKKMQLSRRPTNSTSEILADTGLKIHVAGHMHINDTGVFTSKQNNTLVNIQAPSLAAYVPAYKILTLLSNEQINVETVVLKDVPRFSELFSHYQAEWEHLQRSNAPHLWNRKILQAKNYYEFTDWHLRELARMRFLPQEWPEDIRKLLSELNGQQLLILSQLNDDISIYELNALSNTPTVNAVVVDATESPAKANNTVNKSLVNAWVTARELARKLTLEQQLIFDDFAHWNGQDLSVDFYRLCNADQLALADITSKRLREYQLLAEQFSKKIPISPSSSANVSADLKIRFSKIMTVLMQFSDGAPSNNFIIDTKNNQITEVR